MKSDDPDLILRIQGRRASFMRYPMVVFLVAWLATWTLGIALAGTHAASRAGPWALIVATGVWLIGAGYPAAFVYRLLRPAHAEELRLGLDRILYDSGVPPYRGNYLSRLRANGCYDEAWARFFPKRVCVTLGISDLKTLRLVNRGREKRLTVTT